MGEVVKKWLMLRPGEGRKTAYFLLLNILLGIGMAIGRASSEALFFSRVGVDQLPRFYILLSVVLLLGSVFYAAFVDRWSAERLMRALAIALMLTLLITGALIQLLDGPSLYYGYFLLYELVSEILIIHMAFYLAQNLDLGQGKRLMPTILAGSQIGIVIGGIVVATLSASVPTVGFLYIWAATILFALALLHWWHRRMGRSPYFFPKPQRRATAGRMVQEIGQGARALWTIPLARAGAVTLFLMVIAFYLLNFAVNTVYVERYPEEQSLVAFFGWLNAGLSLTAIITQIFLSNRMIQWLGIKHVSLIYPLGNVLSFGALIMSFSLLPALLGSLTRGVLMPAFRAPSSNLIYSVMSRRMQGRVRAAMLGLVMPAALVLCGVVLDWLVKHYTFELILWLGAGVSMLYVASNLWRSRCYHRELVASLKGRVFLRNIGNDGVRPGNDVMTIMANGFNSDDEDSVVFFAEMLARYEPATASQKIAEILPDAAHPLQNRLLRVAIEHRLKLDRALLSEMMKEGDDHLQATVLRLLSVSGDALADTLARSNLEHRNPRIRAESLRHHIALPGEAARVVPMWQEMFRAQNREEELALATLAEQVVRLAQPDHMVSAYQHLFIKMLKAPDERTLATALEALGDWHFPISADLVPLLERQLRAEMPTLRHKAHRCLALLPPERGAAAAWQGLEDSHTLIREISLTFLEQHCGLGPAEVAQRLGGDGGGHPRQVMTLLAYVEDKGMPREAYEAISGGLLRVAQRFAAAGAWTAMGGERLTSRGEVLLHALRERFHQLLDASLAALQGCENREELRIVRAILTSDDPGSRARAGEVIYNIHSRDLARRLMETIDHAANFDHCMQHYRHLFTSREEAWGWCRSRGDRWLAELAGEQ